MSEQRRPNPSDPTAERTSDMSTPTASGLGGGRPGVERARRNAEDEKDDMARGAEDARATPRRRPEGDDADPVMPDDDATLGTKI